MPAGRDSLPIFLKPFSRPDYKSDAASIYGTQVENTDLYPQVADLAANWNRQYAYPKMQFSGFAEAMQHIAGQLGDSIPDRARRWRAVLGIRQRLRRALRGHGARQRAARAFGGENLHHQHADQPGVQPDHHRLNRMWRDMVLMDEHTWTADRSVSDPGT